MLAAKNLTSRFVLFMTILFMVASNGVNASPIDSLGTFYLGNSLVHLHYH